MKINRQLTIYGYILESEKALSLSVASGIILIFIAFYGYGQRFHPKWEMHTHVSELKCSKGNIDESDVFGTSNFME